MSASMLAGDTKSADIAASLPPLPERMVGRPFGADEAGRPITHTKGHVIRGAVEYMLECLARRAAKESAGMSGAERETRDAYLGVIAEKARVTALQQSVKSNLTALEATEAGFEVGTRTTVDVLDARRRLFEAQRDYARSRYDYLINLVRLKSASGVLAPADLASINAFLTTPTALPPSQPPSPPPAG